MLSNGQSVQYLRITQSLNRFLFRHYRTVWKFARFANFHCVAKKQMGLLLVVMFLTEDQGYCYNRKY